MVRDFGPLAGLAVSAGPLGEAIEIEWAALCAAAVSQVVEDLIRRG